MAYNVITDSKRKEIEYKATHKEPPPPPPPPPTDVHKEAHTKEPVKSAPQKIKLTMTTVKSLAVKLPTPTQKITAPTEKPTAQCITTILIEKEPTPTEKITKRAEKMKKPPGKTTISAGKTTVPAKKSKQSHADIESKYIEIGEPAKSKSVRLHKTKSKSGSGDEKRKVPTKIPQPNYLTMGKTSPFLYDRKAGRMVDAILMREHLRKLKWSKLHYAKARFQHTRFNRKFVAKKLSVIRCLFRCKNEPS